MPAPIVPLSKIGTPFQSPSWRYKATLCPERFGFAEYCSKIKANSGCLARLMSNGVTPVEKYILPIYITQLMNKLPKDLGEQLLKVWNKHYFKNRQRKVTFNVNENSGGLINWHSKKIEKLNDDFLKKLIRHCYHIQGDEYIAEAIKFRTNPNNDVSVRWMNYSFYGGRTDREIAIHWHKPVKFVQALRLTFFDYSGWPKDKLVQYSQLRQLVSNNEIDDKDYHNFRRIYDLGDIGLRSILGYQLLNEYERDTIKNYLAGAGVDNLMDQRYAITNLRESISFNRSIAEYANIGLRKVEMEQRAAVMRLTAQRIEKEMGIENSNTLYMEDTALLNNLRELMSQDQPGEFPAVIDVKSEIVKKN